MKKIKTVLFVIAIIVLVVITPALFMLFTLIILMIQILEKVSYHSVLYVASLSTKRSKRIFLDKMKRISKQYRAVCTAPVINYMTGERMLYQRADSKIPEEMYNDLRSLPAPMADYSISKIRARLLLGKKLYSCIVFQ